MASSGRNQKGECSSFNSIAREGLHDCVRTMQTMSEKFTSLPLSEGCKLCQKVANCVRKWMQTVSDRYLTRILDQSSGCKLCQKDANHVRILETMSERYKLCPTFANYVRNSGNSSFIKVLKV